MKTYIVGGYVRDKLMGRISKDIDFAVEAKSFEEMRSNLLSSGHKIYLEKEEFGSIRAHSPRYGPVDYTLCRSDGVYTDGRRPDSIVIGDIHSDLARRDFTCNAIAIDPITNQYIDPFNGRIHIRKKQLTCVGYESEWKNATNRIEEDKLRIIRALRFVITKGFLPDPSISHYLSSLEDLDIFASVSIDRVREELTKCFQHSTAETLIVMEYFFSPRTIKYLFEESGIWLLPTTKANAANAAI